MSQISISTPIGPVFVEETMGMIIRLGWSHVKPIETDSLVLKEAVAQLKDYFNGSTAAFDLPLKAIGSPFQQRVWSAICTIPYGETRTYGQLAAIVKSAPRAVGRVCGANPIPIIIPCHRVVGAHSIGGYSGRGGHNTKLALLNLENRKILL